MGNNIKLEDITEAYSFSLEPTSRSNNTIPLILYKLKFNSNANIECVHTEQQQFTTPPHTVSSI